MNGQTIVCEGCKATAAFSPDLPINVGIRTTCCLTCGMLKANSFSSTFAISSVTRKCKSFNARKNFHSPLSPLGGRRTRAFLEKLKPLLETQVKREDAIKRLEELAVEAIRKQGAKIVEAYPVTTTKDGRKLSQSFAWTGPMKIFEELGFKTVQSTSPLKPLVRLELQK